MSIKSQVDRLTNAREIIKQVIATKGVQVPADTTLDKCADYISQIESQNAEMVDGYHFEVRWDGTEPPSNISSTISLVVTRR